MRQQGAAGDMRILRRIYLAVVWPMLLIHLRIVTVGSGDVMAALAASFQVALLGFTALAILVRTLRIRRVSLDTILGGVCVYLLIGETFASLFGITELMRGARPRGGHLLKAPPNVESPDRPPSRADLLQLSHSHDRRLWRHRAGSP